MPYIVCGVGRWCDPAPSAAYDRAYLAAEGSMKKASSHGPLRKNTHRRMVRGRHMVRGHDCLVHNREGLNLLPQWLGGS